MCDMEQLRDEHERVRISREKRKKLPQAQRRGVPNFMAGILLDGAL